MGAEQEALKTDRGGICRHRSFSLGKRATQEHLCSNSPLPYFRHSVRKPMLSRSTGCRQKTLQARQSACRWITITTCLFIHVFIRVFIFSLHCEGDKKCWLRQWHADTRKHLLDVEVGFPLKWKLVLGSKATRQLVTSSPLSVRDCFILCENKSIGGGEKQGADCERRSGAARAAWQAPYIWLIWPPRAHTAPQMEGNSYQES